MNLNREEFIQTLESVKGGVADREIIEQSSCFVFRDRNVYSFNDEIACQAPSGLDDSFHCATKADPLVTYLGKMPDDLINLEMEDSKLIVRGKGRRARFAIEKEIVLSIDLKEEPQHWLKLPDNFFEAVRTVSQCASKDESKLTVFVHIHPSWIEANDEVQICRWKMNTKVEKDFIVRSSSIKQVVSLGMKEMGETNGWVHFRDKEGGLRWSCRRFLEEYEIDSACFDVKGEKVQFPKGLVEVLERAGIFSKENENNYVLVELKAGKAIVRAEGITGDCAEKRESVAYNGRPISFLTTPDLLKELVERYSECIVSNNMLKVQAENFDYVARLGFVQQPEQDNLV